MFKFHPVQLSYDQNEQFIVHVGQIWASIKKLKAILRKGILKRGRRGRDELFLN